MPKILTIFLLTFSLSSSLLADIVFDLGAQQFYYCATTITDKNGDEQPQFKEASYDVGTAIVSTGLASINGYYRPDNYQSGHFGVQIKEPKAKWAVNFSMYAYLGSDDSSVQFLSENGQSFTIHFDNDTISVNGEKKTDEAFSAGILNSETDISASIYVNGDNIEVIINGDNKFIVKKPNFKLAKVDISLYTDNDDFIYKTDKLHSLTISTSD